MNPDRWRRIEELFHLARALPAADRNAYLAARTADDPAIADEVLALIDADSASDGIVTDAVHGATTALGAPPLAAGAMVGDYRVIRELGRGGMGAVYLGERADAAYEASVAIKVLRADLASEELVRRFLAERQILATLRHPNIARLLDGGTTERGLPFVVMEYVDGVPIDVYCERRSLSLVDRLELMRRVCAAVQHAHARLVIHRDIKPGNILVEADGAPKLLDFGIATLVAPDGGPASSTTVVRAMTPTHASPEQIRGRDVTTATDVYSLGVVLYQLLTGALPLDLRGLSPAELEQRVAEVEPTPPSGRSRAAWSRSLRGDIDNVVLKALSKEPERRYGSAAELADDLRRHLTREPVAARPATVRYRAGRFVRRHAGFVGAASIVTMLLAALAATSTIQARRVAIERDRAEARRVTAERVTGLLAELFVNADPNESGTDTLKARQLLDIGAERVLSSLLDEPVARASLAIAIGSVYRNLAELDRAQALLDTALVIRRRLPDAPVTDLAEALYEKAELLYTRGDYDSSATVHRSALELRRRAHEGDHTDIAISLAGLAGTLDATGRYDEAEPLYRESVDMYRRIGGPESADLAIEMRNLAAVLRHQANYDDALALLRDALAILRKVRGERNLEVTETLNHLSRTLSLAGKVDEALPIVREAIEIQRSIHRGPHPEIAAALGNYAGMLASAGRLDESEAARRESLAMLRTVYRRDHPYVAATLSSLGDVLRLAERYAAAESSYTEALAMQRRTLAKGDPNLGYSLTGLGLALLAQGRAASAERYLREGYETRRSGLPQGHWQVAWSGSALGACLTMLQRFGDAEPLLRESATMLEKQFGTGDARVKQTKERLAELFEATGRADEAARLRAG